MDREGYVLKLGDNGWARGPIPPHLQKTPSMRNERVRMEWADAYLIAKGHADGTLRVCYMLAGDEGGWQHRPLHRRVVKVIVRTGASQ